MADLGFACAWWTNRLHDRRDCRRMRYGRARKCMGVYDKQSRPLKGTALSPAFFLQFPSLLYVAIAWAAKHIFKIDRTTNFLVQAFGLDSVAEKALISLPKGFVVPR